LQDETVIELDVEDDDSNDEREEPNKLDKKQADKK